MKLLQLLPASLAGRLTRYALPLAVAGVLVLLVAGVAVAALVSPGGLGIAAARVSATEEIPAQFSGGGLDAVDQDNDGLSDALENYLYGTDPLNWNSSGLGIPDGWLVQFGHDPLAPLTVSARGAAPPANALPEAYADGWPEKYRPTLAQYYAYGKPDDYVPGESAPWWRQTDAYANPSQWDQSGTGIPTGWLVHYNLPIRGLDPARVLPGSAGNLTVRQAFEHDTDPRASDSDGDGLEDYAEIFTYNTLPNRFSTAGTGIADGWLLHFGLNPFDPAVAGQDPDRDGLTNLEEFFISEKLLRARVDRDGIRVLNTDGLDPLDWQTSGTGIPDGWYVRYDLSPFDTDPDAHVGRASDWPHFRTYVPADLQGALPRAADLAMTIREAYAYGRPADWNETAQGVWWGGTNPATLDTDEDGIPDPVEILGWYANVTFLTGPEAKPRPYLATSNPLESDSDGDGLSDLEEYLGRSACGVPQGASRAFPPTDPRNRDTAFSGLTDFEKVCGALRGDAKYDLLGAGATPLDPTRADSAGDHMRDGGRLAFWHDRYTEYRANPRYPYNGSAYRTVFEWTSDYARFSGMGEADVVRQFRPDGDVDGDGILNVLDADPSGGLYVQRFGDESTDALTKVFFLGGPQMDPALYANTEFASSVPHSASDPANPDTDGDGLPDSWETRFGTFDPVLGGWNLDPAELDSNRDGTPDGEANNDGDEIEWYAYFQRGTGVDRQRNTFAFNNLLEFAAGTDPNRVSTVGDGIPDGWKAFWGSRVSDETFLNLLAARDARVGDVALAQASALESVIPTSNIAPLNDLRGAGDARKITGYVRVLNVTSCSSPDVPFESLLRDGERLAGGSAANACKANVVPLEGRETNFLLIEGAYRLDYKREVDLRTNPYLTDTDGDGAPDAYEAYMLDRARARVGSQAAQFPHPANPDGERDPDGDGLGPADECASRDGARCGALPQDFRIQHPDGVTGDVNVNAGADPNVVDSDGDGIDDGIELEAGLNPLDPSDVANFRDPSRDSDRDGVPDYLELTGWGRGDFGINVRTDPQNPDSDFDGALDGENRNVNPATQAALAADWLARGLAHRTLPNGSLDFYGEKTAAQAVGARPNALDASGTGIPDGWRIIYPELDPADGAVQEAYKTFRPSWWDEAVHGVWWWGVRPGFSAGDDLDADGLHDTNGEDPMPFNHANVVVYKGIRITDPRELQEFVEDAATVAEMRARAQALGDRAGDPQGGRAAAAARTNDNGVLVREDRARVEILDVRVTTNFTSVHGQPRITKGVPFHVEGRVVLAERNAVGTLLEGSESERVGVANRTAFVSFFTPQRERVVGAGYTNATGWFNITANISAQQTFEVLDGTTMLGAVSGTASASFDASIVHAGNTSSGQRNRILAWVANTSTTVGPGNATYGEHRALLRNAAGVTEERITHATNFSVSRPVNLSVYSETRFVSGLASQVENGARLAGEVILQDASGAPVGNQPVRLEWEGSVPPRVLPVVFTDREGKINLTALDLPALVRSPGAYALELTFTSSDAFLKGASERFSVVVRNPTRITASLDTNATTVGESIVLEGTLSTREVRVTAGETRLPEGVDGQALRVQLGGLEEVVHTDASGRFRLRLQVPGTLAAGAQSLLVSFAGSDDDAPTSASVPLAVKRKALIVDLNRVEGPRSIDVTLTGRLVDNEGKGFQGILQVAGPAGRLGQTEADRNGRFSVAIPLRALELGSQQLQVIFPGDSGHGRAQNTTTARVTSTTTLDITRAPAEVVRGDSFVVEARLVDDRGLPVDAAAVNILWRGERIGGAVTDGDGRVSFTVPTNRTERTTVSTVALRYDPPGSSVFRGSTDASEVRVKAGSVLTLDPHSVRRGAVMVTGTLFDDEERPLPASTLLVRIGDRAPQQAVTARNGSFELPVVLPEDFPLGRTPVRATFAGTGTVAGANATVEWLVRSPLRLDLSQLGPFVRGEGAPASGRLQDDRARPVDLPIQVRLDGAPIGVLRGSNGAFNAEIDVPANATRGVARLVLAINGTDQYERLERTFDVVVKIRPTVDVQLPALAIRGFAFRGEVTLLDDTGEPLRNTTFAYAVGADGSPVSGRTDAEGRAELALVAPLTGDATVGFTVRGGPDVVGATSTYGGIAVVGPSTPVGYAGLALAILLVLAIIGAVVLVTVLRRRQLTEAREIIDEAIRELLAGNEYAGTIFLAYKRFAAHLARHGFTEKASDTPREFALGVRKALPVGAVPLRELIRLFEEARYSDHPIGSDERDRAVESLALVRNELDRLLGRKAAPAVGGVPA